MSRGPLAPSPSPAPTGAESRAIDRWSVADAGVPSSALMERAGTHAATLIARHLDLPTPARVVVLAGGGDNGGDARIVARCLDAWGHHVRLLETASDSRSDLLTRGRLTAEGVADLSDELLACILAGSDAILDGMLGTGASGELRGEVLRVARILDDLEGRTPTLVSLDVPTGTDADTGAVVPHALHAGVTIAFGWPKLGTLLHPARGHAGRMFAVEIGFPEIDGDRGPAATWAVLDPEWARAVLPRRSADTHKNEAGPVLVVAGSEGMAGAAVLSGRAALRSGAGYVRVASVPSNRQVIQTALPEAVWVDRSDATALGSALEACRAVVVGPGLGTDDAAAEALRTVLAAGVPAVVDADALNLIAQGGVDLRRSDEGSSTIVTPHPGEAARLLGADVADIQADRLGALERLRDATGSVVLLKGSPSLVAGAGRVLDPTGSSDLATAGVGDVLAGVIGGLVAQGLDGETAAALGLWLTSTAARLADRGPGLQSADLPCHLPAAMAVTRAGRGAPHVEPWVTLDLPATPDRARVGRG